MFKTVYEFENIELRTALSRTRNREVAKVALEVNDGLKAPTAIPAKDLCVAYSCLSRHQALAAAEQDSRDSAYSALKRVWPGAERQLLPTRERSFKFPPRSKKRPPEGSLSDKLSWFLAQDGDLQRQDLAWIRNFFCNMSNPRDLSVQERTLAGELLVTYCCGRLGRAVSVTVLEAVLRSRAWDVLTTGLGLAVNEIAVLTLLRCNVGVREVSSFFASVHTKGTNFTFRPYYHGRYDLLSCAVEYFIEGQCSYSCYPENEGAHNALAFLHVVGNTEASRQMFLEGKLCRIKTARQLSDSLEEFGCDPRIFGLLASPFLDEWLLSVSDEQLFLWASNTRPDEVSGTVFSLPEIQRARVLDALFRYSPLLPKRLYNHAYREAIALRAFPVLGDCCASWDLFESLVGPCSSSVDELLAVVQATQDFPRDT